MCYTAFGKQYRQVYVNWVSNAEADLVQVNTHTNKSNSLASALDPWDTVLI